MVNKDMSLNKNSQGGVHTFKRTMCASCGKQHLGNCLARTYGCCGCGFMVHKIRDFPSIKERGKEFNEAS